MIELDVFANTNELNFEYVFGSEEYPEFVNPGSPNGFNDIFAFLASGEGVTGVPELDNQLNIATLPDGTEVSINFVNDALNYEYYRNNSLSPSIAFDGLTTDFQGSKKSLTANLEVVPCNTYRLKFLISDRSDAIVDSGVFISEIRGGSPTVGIDYQNGIQYLVEECTSVPDEVVINIGDPLDFDQTFEVIIGGTATQGVDYSLNIPPTITFPAGDTIQTFPISVITDGLVEGTETITITLRANYGCGDIILSELDLEIEDALVVDINVGQDTVFACTDSCVILSASGAPNYIWTPADIITPNNVADPIACPTENFTATVVGFLGPCNAFDEVEVVIVDPILSLITDDPVDICEGDSVQLFANNNVGNANLTFTPDDGSLGPLINNNTTVMPTVTTTYTASVEVAGCIAEDEITINVDPFDFPELRSDTTLCQNTSTVLASAIESTSTTFLWTPADGLNDPTVSNPIATPDETTTYTLTATSDNNFCEKSETVTITVVPSDVDLENPLPVEICLGESVDLSVNSTHPDLVVWTPETGISPTTGPVVTANPTISTTYIASLTTPEGCMTADTINVRVDSLPASGLVQLIPDKEVYCEGEVVTFVFPVYEPADYADIMHQWSPDDGQLQSPDSLWNLVITADTTTTFVRETVNHACEVTETVEIEVIQIPDLVLTVTPDEICEGQSVQLELTSEAELININYGSSGGSFSCMDCDLSVSDTPPAGLITYSASAETEDGDCPLSSNQVEVLVNPLPVIPNIQDEDICPGEDEVTLNAGTGADNYIWTDADGNIVSSSNIFTASPDITTTYTVSATNDVGDCGAATQQVTVFVLDAPTIALQADNDFVCPGDAVIITADTNSPAENIVWSPGGETGTDTIAVNPLVTTVYSASNTACGITVSSEITIEVSPQYVIDSTTVVPDNVFEGQPVTLTAFTTPTLPGATYIWTIDGQQSEQQGATITVPAPDFPLNSTADSVAVGYSVQVIDMGGCEMFSDGTFIIRPSILEIPNVFTPNGDGTNDFFGPIFSGTIEVTSFSVYNRWGQEVYNNETPETGWDGMFKEKPAPADVYVYVVQYTDVTGEVITEKGDVTLLR